jgi:hypothetical protein
LDHGFLAQVAAFGDGPVVVLVEQDGADEADDGGVVGEDADHVAAAFDLLVDPLERVRRRERAPVASGERGVSEDVGLGALEDRGGLGELAVEDPDDFVQLGPAGLG